MKDITEIRHAMFQRGFAIIPVTGKNPAIEGWQNICANTETINLWPKSYPYHNNTGILTRLTPAIDVDILNEEAAKAIERLIRDRFEEHGRLAARFGLAPKRAFLFRTNKPFRKLQQLLVNAHGIAGEKIEILCNGQQIIAHGIHPDTHHAYDWFGGAPWDELRAAELPLLTEEMAEEFLRDAIELLTTEYGYKLKPDDERKPQTNGGAGAANPSSDWSYLINNILTGADLHTSLTRLAFSFVATGIPCNTTVVRLREFMDRSQAKIDRPADWQDRYDDIPRLVRSAHPPLPRRTSSAGAQARARPDRILPQLRRQQR